MSVPGVVINLELCGVQVSAMARSFRWGPFLPVRPEDTLLHVLLLLSKHQLKAIPVVDADSSKSVRGFITQVLPKFPCIFFQNVRFDVQTDA